MKELQAADFNLTVTEISYVVHRETNPSWKMETSGNRYFILAHCLAGDATYVFDKEKHVLKKGDLLFLPKCFPRKATTNPHDPWAFYSVAFDLEFYSPKSEELLLACPNSASFPDLFPQFAQLYRSWSVKRPGYLVHCRSIILDVLCRLYTRSQSFSLPHNKGIERCIELIHANYQHTYSSRELAEVAGVSPSYFRYLFRRALAFSFNIKIKSKSIKPDLLRRRVQCYRSCGGCGLPTFISASIQAHRHPPQYSEDRNRGIRQMLGFIKLKLVPFAGALYSTSPYLQGFLRVSSPSGIFMLGRTAKG